MSIKVNGTTYESHVEAMDTLKIDKKHIRKIREGLSKHGVAVVGKYEFKGTVSPKKASATKVAHRRPTRAKKAAAKKRTRTKTSPATQALPAVA